MHDEAADDSQVHVLSVGQPLPRSNASTLSKKVSDHIKTPPPRRSRRNQN